MRNRSVLDAYYPNAWQILAECKRFLLSKTLTYSLDEDYPVIPGSPKIRMLCHKVKPR